MTNTFSHTLLDGRAVRGTRDEVMAERVLWKIQDAGPDGISLSALTAKTRWLDSETRKAIVGRLVDSLRVTLGTRPSATNTAAVITAVTPGKL